MTTLFLKNKKNSSLMCVPPLIGFGKLNDDEANTKVNLLMSYLKGIEVVVEEVQPRT